MSLPYWPIFPVRCLSSVCRSAYTLGEMQIADPHNLGNSNHQVCFDTKSRYDFLRAWGYHIADNQYAARTADHHSLDNSTPQVCCAHMNFPRQALRSLESLQLMQLVEFVGMRRQEEGPRVCSRHTSCTRNASRIVDRRNLGNSNRPVYSESCVHCLHDIRRHSRSHIHLTCAVHHLPLVSRICGSLYEMKTVDRRNWDNSNPQF